MDPILEHSLPRPRRSWRERRPSRVERWAKYPIVAYRAALTGTYALTIYFGVAGFAAGVPAINETAPRGFVWAWASIVIIGSVIATVGSLQSERAPGADGLPGRLQKVFRNIELVGSWLLFIALGSYAAVLTILAYGAGDIDRIAAAAGFTVLGATPFGRMVWLMAQLGRRS